MSTVRPLQHTAEPPRWHELVGALGLTAISPATWAARSGSMAVLPVWYEPELAEPARLLQTLRLRPRITSDSGGWSDFTGNGGGLVGLHQASGLRFELAFEHTGDQDELVEHLQQAGFRATVVDGASAPWWCEHGTAQDFR